MGKKGGSSVQNYERPLSQQELQLLETQNQMLNAGIGIAQEQEARSADQYRQWQDTYEPIETGIIPRGATRANGYYSPSQISNANNPVPKTQTQQYSQTDMTNAVNKAVDSAFADAYKQYQSNLTGNRIAGPSLYRGYSSAKGA